LASCDVAVYHAEGTDSEVVSLMASLPVTFVELINIEEKTKAHSEKTLVFSRQEYWVVNV
jgi:hypothetical protein